MVDKVSKIGMIGYWTTTHQSVAIFNQERLDRQLRLESTFLEGEEDLLVVGSS